jgi:hypothetical protein
MSMAIERGIAAAAILTGLTIALAAPSSADDFNGHYTFTETDPSGHASSSDWYVTPCGDGCASVALTPGGPTKQAHLNNGQWNLDSTDSLECEDGSSAPDATTAHFNWDANTLAGTVVSTDVKPVCGQQAGHQETNDMKLVRVP